MEKEFLNIPSGNSREEVMIRDKAIKDFYASWNAEHPDKKMWNEDLQDYIHIRFLSIKDIQLNGFAEFKTNSTSSIFTTSSS